MDDNLFKILAVSLGVVSSLLAIVWRMLQGRIKRLENDLSDISRQSSTQVSDIVGLQNLSPDIKKVEVELRT